MIDSRDKVKYGKEFNHAIYVIHWDGMDQDIS